MSTPTQISVTYVSSLPSTTSVVVIPVPQSLQGLDSGQNAANQTGYSAFDTLVSGITKGQGVRFVDASGVLNFIPLSQITKITTP